MPKIILLILCLLCFFSATNGQILVDGLYNDWKASDLLVEESGDHGAVDIEKLWVSNDEDFLFIRIDLNYIYNKRYDRLYLGKQVKCMRGG